MLVTELTIRQIINKMKKLDVTCAIISLNDKILVVQRGKNMTLPFKWEFPGGKIEKGETEQECIIREIKEELNIEIQVTSRLSPSIYDYPGFRIRLIPFTANYVSGEIRLMEHNQFRFLKKDELKDLDWSEADFPILKEFLKL